MCKGSAPCINVQHWLDARKPKRLTKDRLGAGGVVRVESVLQVWMQAISSRCFGWKHKADMVGLHAAS
eukprot:scaffold148655_cov20-Tisochrysis_lutea.AAC.2